MTATIIRKWFTVNTTTGIWQFDNVFQCYTLEDVARASGIKIQNETCIPAGDYKMRITMSNRFKRLMPLIYNNESDYSVSDGMVKWSGIRAHGGNDKDDTDGCPLLGKIKKTDWVQDNTAFTNVFEILLREIGETGVMDLKIINLPENGYGK